MSFDPKCYELAVYFGLATERLRTALAQHIQDSIEDWLEREKERLEARASGAEKLDAP
jgi:hypothetical protein